MPVDVNLSSDQRHLTYDFTEPLTIEELLKAYEKERAFRDASPLHLNSIVDMSKVRRIPPRWLTAKAGPGFTHPRTGEMLFVGVSPALRILVQTILSIVKYERIKFFTTREQAESHLQKLTTEPVPTKIGTP
ncbi:MAG: hypothetical protein SGJ24_07330 [Chloroflexota bacterium]|nr:hypothetical protein [Chloroflexota bacterium]